MNIKVIDFGYKKLPFRAHYNDAGADVYLNKRVRLFPHDTKALPLGFGLEIPDGYMGMIVPRSGHAKRGIIAHIPPIDSGYRGEIHLVVSNMSVNDVFLEEGERVGQLVILPIVIANFVTDLEGSRGTAAFNSTGK